LYALLTVESSRYAASQLITDPLKDLIVKQSVCARPPDTLPIRAEVHQSRCVASKECAEEVRSILSPQLQKTADLSNEPGGMVVGFATAGSGVCFT